MIDVTIERRDIQTTNNNVPAIHQHINIPCSVPGCAGFLGSSSKKCPKHWSSIVVAFPLSPPNGAAVNGFHV